MASNSGNAAATHFGKQLRKERLAHGWTLREFAARSGIDFTTASRVESGKRPPTEKIALACDAVFPERRGWFAEWYEDSKSWVPAAFRSWAEYESKAAELQAWTPGIMDGLVQSEAYARAVLSVSPGATHDVVDARLAARLERQKRLLREDGPTVVVLVDMAALYRAVGSAQVMCEQCAQLGSVASLDTVTLQVVPPVTIPLATASLMTADDAAYTENALNGSVYTDTETVTRLRRLLARVRSEARPASESLATIMEAGRQWQATGERLAGHRATAASA